MYQMFNGLNTLVGLLLTVCAFLMQARIKNACGSVPLKNSILGVLLIGITMVWVAGMSLYSGVQMFSKNVFAGFVGLLGVTLIGLGSVIVQNSKKECSEDVVCKQTVAGGNNASDDLPCEGAKLWGGLIVGLGCLMVVSAGGYGYFASGANVAVLGKIDLMKAKSAAGGKQDMFAQMKQKVTKSEFPKFSHA